MVKMAAISATVVPEFLHALRLKKREDPTSPALQLEVEGDCQAHLAHKTREMFSFSRSDQGVVVVD